MQLELVDTTRPTAATTGVPAATSRTLPTTVYLPPTTDPAPLIVLAHGASGAPEKFTDLATYWAEHGYVVVVPRFPLTNDQVPEPVLGDFAEQGRDVRFVIDEVVAASARPTGQLAGRVDPERIGLFGLSLGSLTVWSEVFDDPSDPPIDALIQSDGTTLAEPEQIATVTFPVLVAHSDVDPDLPVCRRADPLRPAAGSQVPAHAARRRPRDGRREHGHPGRRGVPAGHDGLLGPHPRWPPGHALPAPDRRHHVVPRRLRAPQPTTLPATR